MYVCIHKNPGKKEYRFIILRKRFYSIIFNLWKID